MRLLAKITAAAGLLALVAAALLWAVPLQAADDTSPYAYRVYFSDTADLQDLAADLDVWTIDHAAGFVVAPLTHEQLAVLQRERWVEAMPLPGPWPSLPLASAQQTGGIPGFTCYRTVAETTAALATLSSAYPGLAQVTTIGRSWDKQTPAGPPGHDLEVLVVTSQATPGPKFRFLLLGSVHARELATSETALRFAEHLLQGYGRDPDATWLLDHGELHVLPIANPDGRLRAEAGILWRKNTNALNAACPSQSPPHSTFGVDLNRNSSFQWNSCPQCSSGNSCDLTYRGTMPASEPETQALEEYMRALFPDVRGPNLADAAPASAQGLMVSLHSYGQYVLFPWGWSSLPTPNASGLQTLARKFGYYMGYDACQSGADGCFYQTDGTTDDFAYGELGVPGYTIELGTWFFEACESYEANIAAKAQDTLRYAFKAAQAPYLSPSGPEIIGLAPAAITLAAGDPLTLTARADDTRSSGGFYGSDPAQPIQAAQVTINTPPWDPAALAWPLRAVDGRFDQVQEEVVLEMDTACWAAGRHLLYVRGQDMTGQWGAPSAAFVEVTEAASIDLHLAPPPAPAQDLPAVYTVTITNTAAVTATFELIGEPDSWTFEFPAQPLDPLPPGAASSTVFTVTAPAGQPPAVPARIIVTTAGDPVLCREAFLTPPQPPSRGYFPFLAAAP